MSEKPASRGSLTRRAVSVAWPAVMESFFVDHADRNIHELRETAQFSADLRSFIQERGYLLCHIAAGHGGSGHPCGSG